MDRHRYPPALLTLVCDGLPRKPSRSDICHRKSTIRTVWTILNYLIRLGNYQYISAHLGASSMETSMSFKAPLCAIQRFPLLQQAIWLSENFLAAPMSPLATSNRVWSLRSRALFGRMNKLILQRRLPWGKFHSLDASQKRVIHEPFANTQCEDRATHTLWVKL